MGSDFQNQPPHTLLHIHVTGGVTSQKDSHHRRIDAGRHLSLPSSAIATLLSVSRKYQRNSWRIMSRRNASQLDLKLNLSTPARRNLHAESPSRSSTSPPSSCVSSDVNQDESRRYSTSPEAISMMLVGCPRCLMYVMLAEEDPRCPKCKSSVLLDVIHDKNSATKKTKKG